MAGKSWQPSHEPPRRREREQAPITLIKQWKEEGKGGGEQGEGNRGRGTGGGEQPMRRAPALKRNTNAHETLTTVNAKTYNALRSKRMWNPDASVNLCTADCKGRTCAPCCQLLHVNCI